MQIPSTTTPIRPMVYVSHHDHGQREERKTPSQYPLIHQSPAISHQPSASRQFQANGPGWEMDTRPSNDLHSPKIGSGNQVATVLSHKPLTINGGEPNWITREDHGLISGGNISHGFSKINSEMGTRVEDSNKTSVCPTPNQSRLSTTFPPPPSPRPPCHHLATTTTTTTTTTTMRKAVPEFSKRPLCCRATCVHRA